ncbi:MAG: hypothetical protein N3F09_04485 [Bacteroidia bacterium]|nr:hypothetical protein [Bacteroidia bacterium]
MQKLPGMEQTLNKREFLKQTFPKMLEAVNQEPLPLWGKLNFQGMIEHMSESVAMAYGKVVFPVQVDEATMEKLRNFMLSDKPFRPGTPNTIMGEHPPKLIFENRQMALEDLKNNIHEFFDFYAKNSCHIQANPFFGKLNFDEWVHLLCKHARHHLNQFGLLQDPEYALYLRNSTHK